MSGASPWLQWRVGKWVANHRSDPDPDGRVYDPYNDGPATPLFHLGHGLSFTSFDMSNLTVTPMPRGPTVLAISLSVRNTGTRAGAQVVQAYAIDPICEYAPLFNTCTHPLFFLASGCERLRPTGTCDPGSGCLLSSAWCSARARAVWCGLT